METVDAVTGVHLEALSDEATVYTVDIREDILEFDENINPDDIFEA